MKKSKQVPQTDLRKQNILVAVLSVVLLAVVAFLYIGPNLGAVGWDKGLLPMINAWVNGFTTIVLLAAFVAVKNGHISRHKRLMLFAVGLSVIFLVMYVMQHASFEGTRYPEAASGRGVYLFILLTHIVGAAAIVPLVLLTLSRAFTQRFDQHKKLARVTLPLWLYVSITGVVVYLMISPYY